MANLKEIRNRITSVNSTMQITSAMKMVSAAKLKRAQDAITQMRPYAEKLQELLSNLSSSLDSSEGIYSQEREVKNVLIVAVSSNKGLCGGFNNNVIKKIKALKQEHANVNVDLLSIGKKVREFGNKTFEKNDNVPANLDAVYEKPNFGSVAEVAEQVMQLFVDGVYDKVVVVYNQFKNAATQVIMEEQFLPILPPEGTENANSTDYIFEPSKNEIVETIIPKSLKIQLYKAVLDSQAAEHGARMTAMHKATDNAKDLLFDLKLTYNKARQAAITNEILEIVGGAAALEA